MAVTQNTYTGDGSTVLFSFTFPYLETTDIKVSVNGTATTAYTLANATTVQFNTAPVNGAAIRIYRETDDSNLQATFYPGSAIRSSDLNDNFTQNLYVTQEANNVSAAATTTANTALTNSNTAISTANTALSTANTADTNASAAVTTANTASTNASAAVSTANTASSNATTAVNTANSAAADAATALSTANTALSTANTASTNATAAVSTANTASSNASAAVSTANTASSNASAAVSTANTASSNASTALSTANTAISTANAAASAVANAILYDTVANVAAIPGSPANNDAVEVVDSTGIESFTPLSGVPTGFVGDSGLSVRLVYTTTGSTWNWIQYFPNDPEARYGDAITTLQGDVLGLDNSKLALAGGTMTGTLTLAADPTTDLQAATKQYVDNNLPPGTTVSDTAPSTPGAGDLWYDSVGGRLYVWYYDGNTGQWVDASPQGNRIADFSAGSAGSPGLYVEGDTDTGIYSPGANQLAISTGGSERLRVTSGGLVGIGDSAPESLLHLKGSSATLKIENSVNTGYSGIEFDRAADDTHFAIYAYDSSHPTQANNVQFYGYQAGRLDFHTNSSASPRLSITSGGNVGIGSTTPSFVSGYTGLQVDGGSNGPVVKLTNSTTGSTSTDGFDIILQQGGSDVYIWQRESAPLIFGTAATERARITSSGQLLVGTSSASVNTLFQVTQASDVQWCANLEHTTTSATPLGIRIKYTASSPNNAGAVFLSAADSSATRFELRSNGGLANYSANNANLSDRNAKKDITPAAGTWDCLKQWEIVNYRYKDQPDDADLNLGVIAQQVAESCPEVITVFQAATEDEPEKLGVKEQQMYWMAIKALQEAQLRIETLEAQNADILTRLTALEGGTN